MKKPSITDQCSDETLQIVINLPCRLAKRIQKYAEETGSTFAGVVIEALDALVSKGHKHDCPQFI